MQSIDGAALTLELNTPFVVLVHRVVARPDIFEDVVSSRNIILPIDVTSIALEKVIVLTADAVTFSNISPLVKSRVTIAISLN